MSASLSTLCEAAATHGASLYGMADTDAQSVDLLADSPVEASQDLLAPSPGTQTLDQLSQSQGDLSFYSETLDVTKYERDVAQILHSVKSSQASLSPSSSAASSPDRTKTTLWDLTDPATQDYPASSYSKNHPGVWTRHGAHKATHKSTRPVPAKKKLSKKHRRGGNFSQLTASQTSFSSKSSTRAVALVQYNLETGCTIQSFPSLRKAARDLNIVRHHLVAALKGERDSAGGFGWRLAESAADAARTSTSQPKKTTFTAQTAVSVSSRVPHSKRTRSQQDDATTTTTDDDDAGEEQVLRVEPPYKTRRRHLALGKENEYARDDEQVMDDSLSTSQVSVGVVKNSQGPVSIGCKGCTVQQIDRSTGRVVATFKSLRAAEDATKISRLWISEVLNGKRDQAGDYGWQKAAAVKPKHLLQNNSGPKTSIVRNGASDVTTGDKSGPKQKLILVGDLASDTATIKQKPPVLDEGAPKETNLVNHASDATSSKGKATVQDKGAPKKPHDDQHAGGTNHIKTDKDGSTAEVAVAVTTSTTGSKKTLELTDAPTVSDSVPNKSFSIGRFRILRLEISEQGKLGMQIGLYRCPDSLLEILNPPIESACKIASVDKGGLAYYIGLRKHDCFVEPIDHGTHRVRLRDYQELKNTIKSGTRPLVVFVARQFLSDRCEKLSTKGDIASDSATSPPKIKSKVEAVPHGEAELAKTTDQTVDRVPAQSTRNGANTSSSLGHIQMKEASIVPLPEKTPQLPTSVAKKAASKGKSDSKCHPFCSKCCHPSKFIPMHHPWCPQHQQFEVSGSKEILEGLCKGAELNCRVCKEEYSSGRTISDGIHRINCPRLSLTKKADPPTVQKPQTSSKSNASQSLQLISTRGRAIRPTTKVRFASADVLATMAGHDDSSVSEFEAPEPKTAKTRDNAKTILATTKQSKGKVSEHGKTKRSKKNGKGLLSTALKKTPSKGRSKNEQPCRSSSGVVISIDTSDIVLDASFDMNDIEPIWKTSESPWGLDSVKDSDTIVFAPNLPLSQQEGAFLSDRFAYDVFSSHEQYCKTHTQPEEGYHQLIIRRDTLCRTPWGFSVCRHDIGGACLVEDVVPMSPAAMAVSRESTVIHW